MLSADTSVATGHVFHFAYWNSPTQEVVDRVTVTHLHTRPEAREFARQHFVKTLGSTVWHEYCSTWSTATSTSEPVVIDTDPD